MKRHLFLAAFLASSPLSYAASPAKKAAPEWGDTEAQYKEYTAKPSQGIAGMVGDNYWITKQDLDDWQAAHGCYPEPLNARHVAWIRLIENGVTEEILKKYSSYQNLSMEALAAEEKRIDESTRAPDILDCIKKQFGSRRSSYWKVYIAPILTPQASGKFWLNDPIVQGKTFALRDRVQNMIKTTPDLKKISQLLSVDTSTAAFTYEQKTLHLNEPKKKKNASPVPMPGDWSPFHTDFINKNLKDLKPGEVKKETEDDPSGFLFYRLIKVKKDAYTYESLNILRSDAEFRKTVKIPVRLIEIEPEHKSWLMGVKNATLLLVDWKE